MICASLMHSLVLNLIRSELEQYILKDTGSDVVDEGGLLDRRELAEALGKVDWYSELRDGRVLRVSLTDKQLVTTNLATGRLKSFPNLTS